MYKADKKRYEFGEEMESLAKNLLMDIVDHRIETGNMDETDDGEYSILTADYSGDYSVNVYVSNTYDCEYYIEKQKIESVYLGSQIYLGLASGEEVYFHSLPLESMVSVCIMLEDFLDEEESE